MSEQPTYYTLKQPIKAWLDNDEEEGTYFLDLNRDAFQWMEGALFEQLFQPLDIETIRQQVEEAIAEVLPKYLAKATAREVIRQNAPTGHSINEQRAVELYGEPRQITVDAISATTDAVLAVVGITKETK